jgi:adenylate cyclase
MTRKVSSRRDEVLEAYAEGLRLYRQRDWTQAAQRFQTATQANPADRPSRLFVERCRQLHADATAGNWDGVWVMGHN